MKLFWMKILQKIFLSKTFWLIYIDDDDDTLKKCSRSNFQSEIASKFHKRLQEMLSNTLT